MQLIKERQFTVTTYVLHEGKTLLVQHPKFQKWMPPGGHLEENETPPEGAKREVLEETGLLVEFIPDEHLHIDASHAVTLARPYFCLLEQVPAFGDKAAHEHIDLIFLARPIDLTMQSEPAHPTQWFSWEEIEQLHKEGQLFEDAFQILNCVLRGKNRTQEDFVGFGSARQSQIEAAEGSGPHERDHCLKSKASEEDRYGKVGASQNSQKLTEGGI